MSACVCSGPQGNEPYCPCAMLRYPPGEAPGTRGPTSFMLAAGEKKLGELHCILNDPALLNTAAAYHNIKTEWAKFWIGEELNRRSRRDK